MQLKFIMSLVKLNRISFSLFFCLILVFIAVPATGQHWKACHYSCTHCIGSQYTNCIYCQDGFTLNPIKNRERLNQLYYNRLEDHPRGTCLGVPDQLNIFGVVIFWIVALFFIWLKNRTIFYFLNSMQTFALLSLIEVAYTSPISYVLQGFQYFMFVTSANKTNKIQNIQIFDDNRYRMYQFMRQYNFQANFIPVFIFSLIPFVIAFVVPLCKHFAKKQDSLWSICSCINLPKAFNFIQITSIVIFLFLIQESILVVVVGIFLDEKFADRGADIVLVVFYALMLALMVLNICSKNMDIFPNKGAQQTQLIKKCLMPIFIILPVKANIAVAGFMLLTSIIGLIFSRIKPTEKKLTTFHEKLIKRELVYRIIELISILMVVVYWIVQKNLQNYGSSNAVGIVAVVIISVFLTCFFVEVGLQLYGKIWLKQDQRLYEVFSTSMTSLRQSKMLEQTIQNFETTEQGILDMVFFGRNLDLKESPKKSNNIQLNLDNLNQEYENNVQNKSVKSATTSPKHRQGKVKTARTPKHDRSSRFKLTKVFEPQNKQFEIQAIDMNSIQLKREQQTVANNQNDGDKSQRSQILHVQPRTGRKQEAIKTVRQIKIQIDDGNSQHKSPRFGNLESPGAKTQTQNQHDAKTPNYQQTTKPQTTQTKEKTKPSKKTGKNSFKKNTK